VWLIIQSNSINYNHPCTFVLGEHDEMPWIHLQYEYMSIMTYCKPCPWDMLPLLVFAIVAFLKQSLICLGIYSSLIFYYFFLSSLLAWIIRWDRVWKLKELRCFQTGRTLGSNKCWWGSMKIPNYFLLKIFDLWERWSLKVTFLWTFFHLLRLAQWSVLDCKTGSRSQTLRSTRMSLAQQGSW
jgi:hypothetical protein